MSESSSEKDVVSKEQEPVAKAAEVPAASASVEDAQPSVVQRLVADLRARGELGRRQWEDALGRARGLLRRERTEAAPGEAAPATGPRPWERLRARGQVTFTRAQDRGAALLRNVLARVREGVEAAERSVKAPEAATASASAERAA